MTADGFALGLTDFARAVFESPYCRTYQLQEQNRKLQQLKIDIANDKARAEIRRQLIAHDHQDRKPREGRDL